MRKTIYFLLSLLLLTNLLYSQGLDAKLESLAPFVGKTWRGEFKNPDTGETGVDVARWERALNGKAVRVLHSLNDGVYGGETMILWDAEAESLIFFYFTTGGFYTKGTIRFENGKMISNEKVKGSAGGITEVRATSHVLPDGSMSGKSEYFKDGEWIPGHEIVYVEDPDAEVIMK